ncbi:PREDICTED: uncharacterized protein LOC109581919 [Amphimedon queenslandica]|uniref:Uncharacterized protein n=1 Tax=Amphimedon queenslandica TaxID=400682 RepID=A0A1X7UVZ5_AMPQE|nr:PREDICTED: uncharacterized protein LOC109581919 [Amphimedon queenslandica]|eukprot:XP_019851978.1 PREDICTED: uncharacterized protein LOC109581919 [Amphimedon queenslandica]
MKTFIVIILIGGLGYVASGEKVQDSNEGRTTANNKEDEPMGNRNVNYFAANLVDQPLIEVFHVSNNDKIIKIRKFIGHTFELGPELDAIDIKDGSAGVTSNILAYRPNFNTHNLKLAAVFINLENLFPCIKKGQNYVPSCTSLTQGEGGFNKGRPLLQAGDTGNNFKVFSATTSTYGFAFSGCTKFTGAAPCMDKYYTFSIACFLPAGCRYLP